MRRVHRVLLRAALVSLCAAPAAFAGTSAADDLEERYREKLTHEFIEHGGWVTDYDEARATAKKEGKVLFVYFSRSYAP